MLLTFDPPKHQEAIEDRGLWFEDAAILFQGKTFEFEDIRKDYKEIRIICIGKLNGRMMVVGYTQRGDARHIFSMRKANPREQIKYGGHFEE